MSLELLCKNNVLEIIHVPTINSWEHNCPRGLTIKFFQLQDSTEEDCQLVENLVIPEALKQKLQVLRRAQDLFAYNKLDMISLGVPNIVATQFRQTQPLATCGYWEINDDYSFCNCRIWQGWFSVAGENGIFYHIFKLA